MELSGLVHLSSPHPAFGEWDPKWQKKIKNPIFSLASPCGDGSLALGLLGRDGIP